MGDFGFSMPTTIFDGCERDFISSVRVRFEGILGRTRTDPTASFSDEYQTLLEEGGICRVSYRYVRVGCSDSSIIIS